MVCVNYYPATMLRILQLYKLKYLYYLIGHLPLRVNDSIVLLSGRCDLEDSSTIRCTLMRKSMACGTQVSSHCNNFITTINFIKSIMKIVLYKRENTPLM